MQSLTTVITLERPAIIQLSLSPKMESTRSFVVFLSRELYSVALSHTGGTSVL